MRTILVLAVCETLCDRASDDMQHILRGRDMGDASRVVSSRTVWCLAYLYSECYAFRKSLVYAVTHTLAPVSSAHITPCQQYTESNKAFQEY
jgi:hypothetical protein